MTAGTRRATTTPTAPSLSAPAVNERRASRSWAASSISLSSAALAVPQRPNWARAVVCSMTSQSTTGTTKKRSASAASPLAAVMRYAVSSGSPAAAGLRQVAAMASTAMATSATATTRQNVTPSLSGAGAE